MATTEDLVGTRLALHAVAEHVLSAGLHAATGRIGLRAAPGGFGTPWFTADGVLDGDPEGDHVARRLRVDGVDLVVEQGEEQRSTPLTTVGEAAAFADVTPGAPTDVYPPGTPLEPEAPLFLLPRAAHDLARWFALVAEALDALRAEQAEADPPIVQLWPEHFDVATTIVEVNLGGSPGDGGHDEPYLYVGPWSPPEVGGFWNEPFGASLTWTEVPDADAALAFLHRGLVEAAR